MADHFAIKYVDRVNAKHLLATLRSLYNITTDWTASMYCGITLKWDYVARTVNLSMPGYIKKSLETYLDERQKRPQHAPHAGLPPLMAPKSSSPRRLTIPNHSTPAVSPASNKSSAPSCFTDAPLTALFLLLSVLSQRPNPIEQLPQPRPSPSSSTTVPPIQMPPYGLLPAKCTSTFTATLPTFRKFAPAPVKVATSFSAKRP